MVHGRITSASAACTVVAFVATTGCGSDARREARIRNGPTVFDSAGVTIVDHGRVDYGALPRWRMASEPSLDIGRVSGEAEYLLYQVRDALRMPDGSVAIIDGHEVRLYDSDGRHLWSQGREGNGPEEYRAPANLGRLGPDSVVVWDYVTRRLTVVSPEGRVVRTARLDSVVSTARMLGPAASDRFLFFHVQPWSERRAGPWIIQENPRDYWLVDSEGSIRKWLGRHESGPLYKERRGDWIYDLGPWASYLHVAPGPGGMWAGTGSEFEVRLFVAQDRVRRAVRWTGPDRSVTERHRREYDAYVREAIDPGNAEEHRALRFYLRLPKPERFPAYGDLRTDGERRLWLRDYEREDLDRPDIRRWLVLSGDGTQPLARFEHPRTFDMMDMGPGWVLGVEQDTLAVQHVRLYPVEETR